VYLARAADGAFYCGYAVDPRARVERHNAGAGAKALRGKRPVTLAYVRRFASLSDALKYEIVLKKQPHAYKESLAQRWRARKRGE
jgi:putative endonuclease